MKFRKGFVSNSSSSSFVVIDRSNSPLVIPNIKGSEFEVGKLGETEFGWGPETIDDIFSRINFAYIQALYGHKDWVDMLDDVLKEYLKVDTIVNCITVDYDVDNLICGYIDHASSAQEGQNTEIFDDRDTLIRFLFGPKSYIELDNDNG